MYRAVGCFFKEVFAQTALSLAAGVVTTVTYTVGSRVAIGAKNQFFQPVSPESSAPKSNATYPIPK